MSTKTMILTQDLREDLLKNVKNVMPGWNIISGKDPEIWKSHLMDAEIIAGWKKDTVQAADSNNLRWIQTWSAGVNNLPLEELEKNNVFLTSANGVHAYPISETIFGLMLALTRKIHTYVRNQEEKKWHHSHMNQEIHKKTIGIIGAGAIGCETAKIAKAFGMKVIGVRLSGKEEQHFDEMHTAEKLDDILPHCDYIVITLPLTDETHSLFSASQFKRMKNTAFLINIGRGEILVEQDLISALKEGEIAGAGLDVFEKEPLQESSPLWEMENVIITPHTSGSTEYYDERVINDILVPNLKEYLEGKKPAHNLVDYRKGY
ncbi:MULTISPECIES: D-2-hydroxyacid dehydrogenase [Bacillus]|uniref:2-hydroxyacid dehydrogenase n=1 Tax=Bacillus infantis NRRL B-14911 TaxID=1367477 RepID=U5LBX4_9BACI|nr:MULTISPECIES: D-2-hydroxyacid dehydrogenase [Bacillus]AGX04955.1 2-hydroxyacid dehydrogenase [Bacillus infantis NRRL B-14911]